MTGQFRIPRFLMSANTVRVVGYRSSSAPTFGGPAGSEELVLPVALLLNNTLLKKVAVAVLIAAAEAVLSGPVKGKVKR